MKLAAVALALPLVACASSQAPTVHGVPNLRVVDDQAHVYRSGQPAGAEAWVDGAPDVRLRGRVEDLPEVARRHRDTDAERERAHLRAPLSVALGLSRVGELLSRVRKGRR